MPAEWFIAVDSQQRGPFDLAALPAAGIQADTLAWRPGMSDWLPAQSIPELSALFAPPPAVTNNYQQPTTNYPPPANYPPQGFRYVTPQQILGTAPPPYRPGSGDRVAAGLCAIFFGWAGVHKFILGLNSAAWTTLALTFLTCGLGAFPMSIVGLIEGILYLTRSDEEFYQRYVVERRQWF